MANVKVKIDRDQCISCESCWTMCPEVFEQNSVDSWSQIVGKYQVGGDQATGSVPDSLKDKTQEAADACPVTIIHLDKAKSETIPNCPIEFYIFSCASSSGLQIDLFTKPRCAVPIINSARTLTGLLRS